MQRGNAIRSQHDFARQCFALAALFLLLTFSSLSAGPDVDPTRPYLNRLNKQARVEKSDFEYPFLIAQTGYVIELSPSELTKRIRALLREQALPFRGHGGKQGWGIEKLDATTLPLPKGVTEGKQLAGILECTVKYCLMKLNSDKETPTLEAATSKLLTYHGLVMDRVKRFLRDREMPGYEHRANNQEFVPKMIEQLPFLKVLYPAAQKYMAEDFWKKTAPPKSFQDSYLRQELIVFGPDRLQPVHRISEVFEFEEGGSQLFFELFVYTNHYFDSSMRTYEIKPFRGKSLLLLSDVLEIDELTKSGIVRFLYMGEMENAAIAFLDDQVKQFR